MGLAGLLCFVLTLSTVTSINHYPSTQISDIFQSTSQSAKLDDDCKSSLAKWRQELLSDKSNAGKSDMLVNTFGTSGYYNYTTRDHSRFIYNAIQCITVSGANAATVGDYPSQYCYAHTRAPQSKTGKRTVAGCIPNSCKEQSRQFLDEFYRKADYLNESDFLVEETPVCVASRYDKQWFERPLSLLNFALFVLAVLGCFLVSVHEIWFYDEKTATKNYMKVLYSFSLWRNTKQLCKVPSDPMATVGCLFGIRCLSMFWTIVGHSYTQAGFFIGDVQAWRLEFNDNFLAQIITNFTLSVDTFFVLSGCLTAYSFFRQLNKVPPGGDSGIGSVSFWIRFFRHRLVRLWPLYAFFMADALTRWNISNYHPGWPLGDPAIACKQTWWQNLLFLNTLSEDVPCMNWLWYLGDDFLFYALSPLFLVSLYLNRKAGVCLLFVFGVASCMIRGALIVKYNLPPTQMLFQEPRGFNVNIVQQYFTMYIKPWTRITPYLMGLGLGNVLANKKTLIGADGFHWRTQVLMWLAATSCLFVGVFGLWPIQQYWQWHIYNILYGSCFRAVFATGVCLLILVCQCGHGGPLQALLSCRLFVPLSNTSYGAYLFNMIPVTGVLLWQGVPYTWRGFSYHFVVLCLFPIVGSYIYGYIVAIIVEMPVLRIEKLVFSQPKKSATELKRTSLKRATASKSSSIGTNTEYSMVDLPSDSAKEDSAAEDKNHSV